MEALLKATNVWKSFGDRRVLRGISLDVREGEIIGLVGPNGAGKTTFLRISLGVLRRDSGEVLLMGRDPLRDPRAREGVGVVFERPSLPSGVPVKAVLEHAARIRGASRESISRAIRLAGLEGHEDKPFRSLSAGLKQRAALAHALVGDPVFIIADELTSNLDPVERARILDEVSRLRRDEGISFLISSHILPEILRVSDRVVVLVDGRVVAQGAPDEIVRGGLVARIRTPDPESLASMLGDLGFKVGVQGFHVRVELASRDDEAKLYEALARASRAGLRVYSIDLVGAALEEFLLAQERGGAGGA